MKLLVLVFALGVGSPVFGNTLTWTNGSTIATGTVVEMLSKGLWVEVGRVPLSQTSFVDQLSEGVYRVRHYLTPASGPDVFSDYSATGVRLNLPILIGVK